MILVTGFESYGGRSVNPAAATALALDGSRISGELVRGQTVPVDLNALREYIPALLADVDPTIVLCLGLWPGEPMLRLERVAVNHAHFEIADNTGARLNGPILPDAPAAHFSTLPLDAIEAAIRTAGLPCRQSNSAGGFLCNAIFYLALDHCARHRPGTRVGFIHVPYLPSQVASLLDQVASAGELEQHQRADYASMAFENMVEGVRLALSCTLASAIA